VFEMTDTTGKDMSDPTRERLLSAASDVFSTHGYHHATIRQIVEHAGSNIAAVNYHFQGKAGLYSSLFHELIRLNHAHASMESALPATSAPIIRLRAFVRGMLASIMDERGAQPALGKLMIREMIEPTHALDEVVRDMIRPTQQYLAALVADIVGRALSDEEIYFATSSIISQIVFHKHCRAVIDRLFPSRDLSTSGIERHADYLADFCHAGLLTMNAPQPAALKNRQPRTRILKGDRP